MKLSKLQITVFLVICGAMLTVGYIVADQRCNKTDTSKVVTDTTTVKKETKTKVIKSPDGTETTETTVTDETKDTKRTKDRTTESVSSSKIHIQALAGLDTTRNFIPVYGVAVSKDLIGPISIGAFGLTNGVVGASVGISF